MGISRWFEAEPASDMYASSLCLARAVEELEAAEAAERLTASGAGSMSNALLSYRGRGWLLLKLVDSAVLESTRESG